MTDPHVAAPNAAVMYDRTGVQSERFRLEQQEPDSRSTTRELAPGTHYDVTESKGKLTRIPRDPRRPAKLGAPPSNNSPRLCSRPSSENCPTASLYKVKPIAACCSCCDKIPCRTTATWFHLSPADAWPSRPPDGGGDRRQLRSFILRRRIRRQPLRRSNRDVEPHVRRPCCCHGPDEETTDQSTH